ncbi:peptide deformylase [Endozoicomonas sp. OPT23]|uniref:peptide deformylase n=1 Tax=Endozoicomonas sp. OPT23 TaxID=2072845 RepID=UPI00129BEB17|nr:peptide deformylase [Endozoicomonas sp. OPT23]MRI33764.1 peptide deformylase [Endozoicomonas sp. OPT23]
MAILHLVPESNPVLRTPTKAVTDFGESLQTTIDDMFETMYEVRGAGLAATQVGLDIRLAVIDVTADKSQQLVLINPEIIESSGSQKMEMGCLSLPGCWAAIKRSGWVKIRAQDRRGEIYEMEGEGILAEAFQHEIDHLDGVLFIDKLSSLKQKMVRQRAKKVLKRQSRD